MKELHEQAFELVERMFKECDFQLKQFTYSDRSYIKISAPQVFIDLLTEGYKNVFGTWPHRSPEGKLYFRDIEVIPNYEMEVVLFHKDYPKLLQPWMIYIIKLNSGKNIRPGEFNKIDISKDENGNLTATSFFSVPDRPDIPLSDPTKLY